MRRSRVGPTVGRACAFVVVMLSSAGGQEALEKTLRADVQTLAGRIGARDVTHPAALAKAARFVESSLAGAGYTVRRLPFRAGPHEVFNLDATAKGTTHADELVVVGAHYDSVPSTPGADDNASGVAAMLAIARALSGLKLRRSVRFVAFVNEEPPFFKTAEMGSVVYARALKAERAKVVGMLSLETMGYYDARPDTQRYPVGLSLFYPDRGDFVAFVATTESRGWLNDVTRRYRAKAQVPAESIAAPSFVTGVDFSDHWSFGREGFPAVMVTDTAFLRNERYHRPDDTPDTLDYARLAKVAARLAEVVAEVADAP